MTSKLSVIIFFILLFNSTLQQSNVQYNYSWTMLTMTEREKKRRICVFSKCISAREIRYENQFGEVFIYLLGYFTLYGLPRF